MQLNPAGLDADTPRRGAAPCPPAAARRRIEHALGRELMFAALALPLAAPACADAPPEQGTVSLKMLDYRDSQPDASRIRVRAPSLQVSLPVAGDWAFSGTLTSDAVSGASPAYHTSGLQRMSDHRRALDAAVTRYFSSASLTLGASVSSESDYLARSVSAQAGWSSDDRNTTWTAGLALGRDSIDPTNHIVEHEHKRTDEVLFGVTQVLGPRDIAQVNLGLARGRGYFSDPYKVFDSRPRVHDRGTLLVRWNHHLDATGATARWSYRAYGDNWAVRAHTLGLELVQPLARDWTVTPLLRLYTQGAARFYVSADPDAGPFAPNPPADAPTYTEDQRLSAFGARTWGLKVSRRFDSGWSADVKLERYEQRGAWRLFGSGSTGLAPLRARSMQLGLSAPI